MEEDPQLASEAKALVVLAFRNSPLENLHAGTFPSSKTGDGSDIKVISPYGEIPWNNVSRLSDAEMKELMQFAVNKVYTLLCMREFDTENYYPMIEKTNRNFTQKWDEAKLILPLATSSLPVRATGHQ
jgi:hypothetical protein